MLLEAGYEWATLLNHRYEFMSYCATEAQGLYCMLQQLASNRITATGYIRHNSVARPFKEKEKYLQNVLHT